MNYTHGATTYDSLGAMLWGMAYTYHRMVPDPDRVMALTPAECAVEIIDEWRLHDADVMYLTGPEDGTSHMAWYDYDAIDLARAVCAARDDIAREDAEEGA